MKLIKLTFKKVGNHWYPNIKHSNPEDLILDPNIERYLDSRNTLDEDSVDVYLYEQVGFIDSDYIIQFTEEDLCRYFTTNDDFLMTMYIGERRFTISSNLYFLLEQEYQLDLHELVYKVYEYEI